MRLRSLIFAAGIGVPLVFWFSVHAQQQPVSNPVSVPDQQIVAVFSRISQHAAQLAPMLQQVHASEWVSKGAPETYVSQLNSAQQQIQAIGSDMAALSQHPDHMQDCMKALFRVRAYHRSLDSLMGGLRKYQNPPLADLIQSVAAGDENDLDKLEAYIVELANEKEQEFQVVDHEAQRCRATLSRQPAAQPKTARHTNP